MDNTIITLFKKLDKTAKCLVVGAIALILLPPVLSVEQHQDVVLSPSTRYYGNYSVDGHITSSPSGKAFEYFPVNSVFASDYRIKNGNEVWSEYGKVAKIKKHSDGSISIYGCINENVRSAIGHTWKP